MNIFSSQELGLMNVFEGYGLFYAKFLESMIISSKGRGLNLVYMRITHFSILICRGFLSLSISFIIIHLIVSLVEDNPCMRL